MDDRPQFVRGIAPHLFKGAFENLVGFGGKLARFFPIGYGRDVDPSNEGNDGGIAAEGLDYRVNSMEFVRCHTLLITSNFLKCKASDKRNIKFQKSEYGPCMSERAETGGKRSPSAVRFRAIIEATRREHENLAAWGMRMGLSPSAISNFRAGMPVSKQAGEKISRKTDLTLEYIFYGDDRRLTREMSDRMREAVEAVQAADSRGAELPLKGQNIGS